MKSQDARIYFVPAQVATAMVSTADRYAWYDRLLIGCVCFVLVAHWSLAADQKYLFGTMAGLVPSPTHADGAVTTARFSWPWGITTDAAGTIYVADGNNQVIRKVTPEGEVTTIAGWVGRSGTADGLGSAARFNDPQDVAVDSAGNIYVAGQPNTIRKITPDGLVSTFAGSTLYGGGSADGTGSEARFNGPFNVAVDKAGNVYVSEIGNYTIRKITPEAVVTTLAGLAGSRGSTDGTGSAARFRTPRGLTVDTSGNVYVTDNFTIRKITPEGVVTTLAGQAGTSGTVDGTGSEARFSGGGDVAVDSLGNIYKTDGNAIRRITSEGVVTTLAGNPMTYGSVDGTGSAARFSDPRGIAVDGMSNIYVSEIGNHTIRKVTSDGVVTTIAGLAPFSWHGTDGLGSSARFSGPARMDLDSDGNVYVADSFDNTIRKITPAGAVSTIAGLAGESGSTDGTGSVARFAYPYGVAVDATGNVYVSEFSNHTIRKVTPEGIVTTIAGLAGEFGIEDGTGSAARFMGPNDLTVDSDGNIYVADTSAHTIRKITPNAVVTTLAGVGLVPGSADGAGIGSAQFNYPWGIDVDADGNLYVADSSNHAIRKIAPDGVVSTLAGMAGSPGSSDGMGSAARFNEPEALAVDSAGNIYVADGRNHTIRKITPNGAVTTVAGLGGFGSFADGMGDSARFRDPWGVALDENGNLYVADSTNNTIRKGWLVTVGDGNLTNLSIRAVAGKANETLIVGFSLEGPTAKQALVRAIGPTLGEPPFNVPGVLADPQLTLFDGDGQTVEQNDNWGGDVALADAFASVGGFELNASSLDAALMPTLGQGAYTAHVTSNAGTGIALMEAYDADLGSIATRLINLSARTLAGAENNIIIAGFVVGGNDPVTVLIRGVGPTLSVFGVTGLLADPHLTLFSGSTQIETNNDWWTSLGAAFRNRGAFDLPEGSTDAAMLVTLDPGGYTAHVGGMGNTTGVALVELYELR